MSGMSKSSVHRVCKKNEILHRSDGLKCECRETHRKLGRKLKLNARDKRMLLRTLHIMRRNRRQVTVMSLVKEAGLDPTHVHRRTFSKYLNALGFKFLQAQKKELLPDKDKKTRFRYTSDMKKTLRQCPDFHVNHIFYLDGIPLFISLILSKMHVKQSQEFGESLARGYSYQQKEAKSSLVGKHLHHMVAIAHGIIMTEPYEKMSGDYFASYTRRRFNITFAKAGVKLNHSRRFIMDNDLCQTSKKSLHALSEVEAELHSIPARSPDLNPIENIFHLIKKKLAKQALNLQIEKESFEEFKTCVLCCWNDIDPLIIDRTIESLPKRIDAILKGRGCRTKY